MRSLDSEMKYTRKALNKADSLIGTKCKIYYPWKQRFIHRVVYKDYEGYYVKFEGKRRELRIATNDFGEMIYFEVIHE